MSTTTEALLQVDDLRHAYGSDVVIDGLTFDIRPGEFVSIVGPSGCGKTTLLRTVSGLQRPTGGRVVLAGREVDDVPAELALVFQDYSRSLFPWLTVEDNVAFPLRRMGLSKAERAHRVEESLSSVGLAGAGKKFPWQLSGGMQQRASIARALAYQPQILLMDEPFASVDAQTRADLEDLVIKVWEEHQMTVVFVTHDIDESVYLSDRVLVLSIAPAMVLEEITVDLPRPRDQIETKLLSEFVDLRTHVAQMVRASAQRKPIPSAR
jgi:NitT/TauT family transport system ATP-binding protein